MSNRICKRDDEGRWPDLWTPSNRRRGSLVADALERAFKDGLRRDQNLREHDEMRRRRLDHTLPVSVPSSRDPGAGGHAALVLIGIILAVMLTVHLFR
jgi:hypothetical protein